MKQKRLILSLIFLCIITFLVEISVDYYLKHVFHNPLSIDISVIDAVLVVMLLSPGVFLLMYRPIMLEISNRKNAEEDFHMIFDSIPNAILAIVNSKGTIVLVNHQAELIFGYSTEELIGKPIEILVPERYRPNHHGLRNKYMEEPTPRQLGVGRDLFARHKDGREIPVEIGLSPIKSRGDILVLAIITDITVRKKIEIELRTAVETRDEFLSIASHELKTPLTSLNLSLQLLCKLANHEESSSKINLMCDRAMGACLSLSQLLNDLLDVTRIRAGKLRLEKQEMDIKAILIECVSNFTQEATMRGSKIFIIVEQNIVGKWDPMRIQQIISNLLSNAIKYGEGSPIEVTLSADLGMVRLQVKDYGMGISREMQTKIFERFQRAVSNKNITGLGLGLYIVRQIVEAHGGSISVEGELGKGSLFIVELPLG